VNWRASWIYQCDDCKGLSVYTEHPALLVACPTCKEPVDEKCTGDGGRYERQPHKARIALAAQLNRDRKTAICECPAPPVGARKSKPVDTATSEMFG
jgi:ribosomal protein S27E